MPISLKPPNTIVVAATEITEHKPPKPHKGELDIGGWDGGHYSDRCHWGDELTPLQALAAA